MVSMSLWNSSEQNFLYSRYLIFLGGGGGLQRLILILRISDDDDH